MTTVPRGNKPRHPHRRARTCSALGAVVVASALGCGCRGTLAALSQTSVQADEPVSTSATSFDVAIPAGSLVLQNGSAGRISLRGTVTYRGSERPAPAWRRTGTAVSLISSCPGDDNDCGYNYTLRVPKAMSTVVTNTAGGITVRGLGGTTEVNSPAGNVSLSQLTGSLTVSAGAGNVAARDVGSEAVDITDSAGNVVLMFKLPPTTVRVRVSTGNVVVGLPGSARYRVMTSDQLGTVTGSVPDSPSGRLISLGVGTGNIFLVSTNGCGISNCPIASAAVNIAGGN